MLVLSRKVDGDNVILIGPDIRIFLLDAHRGQARIGIEAPRSVNIMRSELVDGKPRISVEPRGDNPGGPA
jgi:carbon storage regulator CsrA